MGWKHTDQDDRARAWEQKGLFDRWWTFAIGALVYAVALPIGGIVAINMAEQSTAMPAILEAIALLIGTVAAHGAFVLWSRSYVPWFYKLHVYTTKSAVKASPVVFAYTTGFLVKALEFLTKKTQAVVNRLF